MEENIFKDYLEGYINVHNELLDIDLSDKTSEIERLNKIIEANEMLVQNYMKVEDIDSNDKEKHNEFEIGTKQYMENIKNAEKEIQNIHKKQQEDEKRKEVLENAKNSIRQKAREYKEEQLAQEHKKQLDNELQNKIYEYNAQEYKINQELEKFKDIELETTKEEVERIKLEGELRKIQADRKNVQQQLNQESDISKKIEKDYILFLGKLSIIDKNPEKILIENKEKERKEENKNDIKKTIQKVENKKENNENKENKKENNYNYKDIKQTIYKTSDIKINEKEGIICTTMESGHIFEEKLEDALIAKKEIYKSLKIKEICKEIAGGRISGLLLGTKVNPAIIYSLRNEPETIKEYINCLKDKTELPFELTHDLRDSSLGIIDKLRMWVHAKAEDKIPGTKVEFAKHLWNKNKALPSAEKENLSKEPEKRMKEEIKIENKDNRIEEKAAEMMKETQSKIAKEIKEVMTKDGEEK